MILKLEEFLYLAAKMVINNEASTKTTHIKAFIIDEISEKELRIVKEEIKYLMFCLLHFYAYAEVAVNKEILNHADEKARNHFEKLCYFSQERAFVTSFHEFDYSMEKFKNRYAKYTFFLGKYNYQHFERSFAECFAAQLRGKFTDNPDPTSTKNN